MTYIKNFYELTLADSQSAGGKGASLGELVSAGFAVPPGFVILADAFQVFLQSNQLNDLISQQLSLVSAQDTNSIENVSDNIRKNILFGHIPQEISDEIITNFEKFGAPFVAVRSSATAEDGQNNAWAGQLESFLNTDRDRLMENVKKCWASLFAPRAISYRLEKNISGFISVAVVVQKMIQSEAAGVAFSIHPVSHDHESIFIEAGYGLGEAVVSGQITPDNYKVNKHPLELAQANIGRQEKALYKNNRGSNEWQEVPVSQKDKAKLDKAQILELAQIVVNIENHYQIPCDIEWALENNHFYIVQCRPITALDNDAPINIRQKKWIEVGAENDLHSYPVILHVHGVYHSRKITGAPINSFLTVEKGENIRYLFREGTYSEAGRIIMAKLARDKNFAFEITRIMETKLRLLNHYTEWFFHERLSKMTSEELWEIYDEFNRKVINIMSYATIPNIIEWEESHLTNRILEILDKYLDNAGLDKSLAGEYFVLLTAPIKKTWLSAEQTNLYEIAAKISLYEKDLSHVLTRSEIGFMELTDQYLEIKKLIREHREMYHWTYFNYEGPEKTDDFSRQMLNDILDRGDTEKHLRDISNNSSDLIDRQEETKNKLKISEADWYWFLVTQELSYNKAIRRDLIFKSYWHLDKLLAEMAKRLDIDTKDARNVSLDEMKEYMFGHKEVDANILRARRKLLMILLNEDGRLDYLEGSPAEELLAEVEKDTRTTLEGNIIRGNVAYPGYARGPVRIIQNKNDMSKMETGDILVSSATTPDIMPAIKKAAAIVTDEGGITCHAAIVSREMKVPCVIGTKIATKVLHDGDLVEVDADNGLVTILESDDND